MVPLIVLIGRTNVGKSTLFNKLTNSHNALVSNCLELTRDRKYGCLNIKNNIFTIIDTAGINNKKKTLIKRS
ncbi:MAG: GTPase [Buchnera aphidicola (Meitanaphis elongallis)]